MGAHQCTYIPDSHLHSTTRIPSSDPTGLHPRPTGGPFSEEYYLCRGYSRHILCPADRADLDWTCIQCCELFPLYGIDDEEFIHLNTNINISVDVKETYELCTGIDLEVFKYSNFKENDHERDIDPDNNFYDIEIRCKYFTDSQFQTLCKTILIVEA